MRFCDCPTFSRLRVAFYGFFFNGRGQTRGENTSASLFLSYVVEGCRVGDVAGLPGEMQGTIGLRGIELVRLLVLDLYQQMYAAAVKRRK